MSTATVRLTGAIELFSKSYRLVRKNFGLFMVLYAIPALLALWDTLGRYVEDENAERHWSDFSSNLFLGPSTGSSFYKNAGGVLLILIVPYIISSLMLTITWLRVAQGDRPTFGQIWREFIGSWLWLKLIGAFLAVGFLTVLGFVLLIIPGVILLWRLFLTPYILIDQKTDIVEAIKRSWNMTRGYAWPIYSILLLTLLLSLTGIIPIIGALVAFMLTTMYSVAPALRYQELKKLKHS